MAVLKGQIANGAVGGAVIMDLADLREEGTRMVAAARTESDRILREARAEAARVRAKSVEDGRAEGFAAGEEAGLSEGRAAGESAAREEVTAAYADRLRTLEASWTKLIGEWESARQALMRDARRETIRLALGIASRVIRRTLEADPSLVTAQLDGALELIGQATSLCVACSENDIEVLRSAMPALLDRFRGSGDVIFVPDPTLALGDVVVRVADGAVDATFSTQIDRIVEALLPGAGGRDAIP